LALYKIGITKDTCAGSPAGITEWADHDDIMKEQLLLVRSKSECGGVMFFSYSFFNPSAIKESSDWIKAVGVREIENLLEVL
ncbi:MAG: hypothetical protein PHR18_05570, partial [Oscillospiraceae bacterium]|nr:hypothetical protein [Oscillospiraceae bacterium]